MVEEWLLSPLDQEQDKNMALTLLFNIVLLTLASAKSLGK